MGDRHMYDRRRREFAKRPPAHYCGKCSAVLYPEDETCLDCGVSAPAAGWPTLQDGYDPWLGRVLDGRYLVTKRVGHGATGAVYRAESLAIVREFAVKIINFKQAPAGVDPEQVRTRLQREIEAISRLRNPHVVPFYEVLELFDNFLGVVMDFIDGDTLEVVVRRDGPMELRRACKVLRQIANGVHEAHEVGMIHRDLKPENAMLEVMPAGDDFVHVLDFGIVRMDDGVSMTRGFLGTPLYASPEQATAGAVDRRSDIYSLGAVFFFLLTGRPPFVSENVYEILRAHVRTPAPTLRDVAHHVFPPELESLVASMLAKNPAARPQSLADVIQRLDTLLMGGALVDFERARESADMPFVPRATVEQSPFASDSESDFHATPSTGSALAEADVVTSERDATGPKAAIFRRSPSRSSVRQMLSEAREDSKTRFDRVRKSNTGVFPVGLRIDGGIGLCRHGRGAGLAVADQQGRVFYSDGEALKLAYESSARVTALSHTPHAVLLGRDDGVIVCAPYDGTPGIVFEDPSRSPITALASDDAATVHLAGSESGKLYLCRANRGLTSWQALQDGPGITAIALNPAGNMFAVARKTREVELFSMASPKTAFSRFSTPALVSQLSFSTDGHLVSVLTDCNAVTLHQSLTGSRILSIKDEVNQLATVGFSSDNELVGYFGIDGALFGVDLQRELARAKP